jgi:chlorite dismutase
MQLQAYGGCADVAEVVRAVEMAAIPAAVYEDVNDPRGVAVVTWSEDCGHFVGPFRKLLNSEPFTTMVHKPQYTMFGRTYSLGYERDLDEWLFEKPITNATNPDWPWAVWYPLRRSGRFMQLDEAEQRKILMEHGHIGMAFGAADYAHDIRLACQGLDANDNDFVIGLLGKDLHPLSAIVQAMRKTTQTSQYLEKLGPFLVGRAVYQHRGDQ